MRFLVFCLVGFYQVFGQQTSSCLTALGVQGECIERPECLRRVVQPLKSLGVKMCKPSSPGEHLVCCPLEERPGFNEKQAARNPKLVRSPVKLNLPGQPLDDADFNRALDIPLIRPNFTKHNPMHVPGMLEGDIVPQDSKNHRQTRAVVRRRTMLWPKAVVPYLLSSFFTIDERAVIARAILDFERSTCLRFVPWTNQINYIEIIKGKGCYSNVGRVGGRQYLSLGDDCFFMPIVQHEMMHALGIYHEQSRADRDKHVVIAFQNIEEGFWPNFVKYDLNGIKHLRTPYDLNSVMHYDAYSYSKNGQPTIYVRRKRELLVDNNLGRGLQFSEIDVQRLNRLYRCNNPLPQNRVVTRKQKTGW